MKVILSALSLLLLRGALAAQAPAEMDVFLVRHAETLANATGKGSESNHRRFSPLGEAQIAALLVELRGLKIPRIVVSPSYRARHTILPFLREQAQVAEIWPELDECGWTEDESPVPDGLTASGPMVQIESDLKIFFRFREPIAPRTYVAARASDCEAQVRMAMQRLEEQCRTSKASLLMVTHYHAGGRLLRRLLGDAAPEHLGLRNGMLTQLRRRADGRFQLVRLNGQAFPESPGSGGIPASPLDRRPVQTQADPFRRLPDTAR